MNDQIGKREAAPKDQEWIYYKEFEEQLYNEPEVKLQVTPITGGPGFYWFGYYDKFQTDVTDELALGMNVHFDMRSPCSEDKINIGIINIADKNKWTKIGETSAWGWQQGCMLQWRPGPYKQIMWNDRVKDRFVTKIYHYKTGTTEEIPYPFYHVSPDGKWALGADFARIQDMRPGYGYPGVKDVHSSLLRPEKSGIYKIDLETGKFRFLFSVADVADIPYKQADPKDDKHYFNHIYINPSGERFIFLHRWKSSSNRWPNFRTRMFTASPGKESDLSLVSDTENISHFIWKNEDTILVWANGAFRIFSDNFKKKIDKEEDKLILKAPNGHQSYFPGSEWILADTYRDRNGRQNLYTFKEGHKNIFPLARLFEPEDYFNEWRCDLHPRITRDGKKAIIDSTHETGKGRQMYIIDLSPVVEKYGIY